MTDPVAAYYDELADRYGDDPRAVDAPDVEALEARYRALGDLCDMNGRRVLEVGCGHGLLGAYLADRYPKIRYRGIDISEQLVKIAHKARPELDIRHADLFGIGEIHYDIVLAQGIFYKLPPGKHPGQLIRQMWQLADKAVAFTAISTWKPDLEADELHIDPYQSLRFCRTLTPWLTLRHDYRLGDVCIYMFRKDT